MSASFAATPRPIVMPLSPCQRRSCQRAIVIFAGAPPPFQAAETAAAAFLFIAFYAFFIFISCARPFILPFDAADAIIFHAR
jgi:hypothetical protein